MGKKEKLRRVGREVIRLREKVPEPPSWKQFLLYNGPVIMIFGLGLGLSELVLYPHLAVKYGISWLGWMVLGLFFQTVWGMELARWVVVLGENATQQHSRILGKWLAVLFIPLPLFVGMAIPAWASSAGTVFWQLIHFPPEEKIASVFWAIFTFVATFLLIFFSGVARKYVEILVLASTIIAMGILLFSAAISIPGRIWKDLWATLWFPFVPQGMDLWVFGSTLAWVGAGVTLLWYTYWMRDAGWGMGAFSPPIPGWRGKSVSLSLTGAVVDSNGENSLRLLRWLTRSHLSLWLVYFGGNVLTLFLIIGLSQAILAPTGLVPEKFEVLRHQALFFEKVLGPAGRILFHLMAWLLVMNTQVSVSEALIRQNTETTVMLFPSLASRVKNVYFGWWIGYLLFASLLLIAPLKFPGVNPFRYITTAAGISFIALVFSMLCALIADLWFPRFISRKIRLSVVPSFWTVVVLFAGFVFHLYWLVRALLFAFTKLR